MQMTRRPARESAAASLRRQQHQRRHLAVLIAAAGLLAYALMPAQLVFAALFGGDHRRPELGVQPTGTLLLCPRETHNCVSTAEDARGGANEYHGARWAYRVGSSAEEAVAELVECIETTRPSNFTPTIIERKGDYVRAEYRSRWFGFVDDFEAYFPAPGASAKAAGRNVVEYRSASRVGNSDLGVNRRRVQELFAELSKRGWTRA